MVALMDGSCARMRSTVSMMLAPGWRKMISVDRALAVQIAGGADVLHRVGHFRDIGQTHGRAVAVTDHKRLVIVGMRNLIVGKDVRRSHCHR